MTQPRPRPSSGRLARWLLGLAIFASTMAIGAVHVPVLVAITGVLFAAAAFAWWPADPLRARRSATLVLFTGVGLTLWTAITIIPVPADLLARVAPHAADVWARCLTPLGRPGPAWVTLSLDPVATRAQVLRGVAYVLVFVTASRIAARREGAVFLERALLVTALALAATALVHPAVGAEKVFGIYSPRRDPGLRHVAPLLNSNTLAGYLNVGISVALGHLFSPRSGWPRTLLAALTIGLVATGVWVGSRGGLLTTVLAVVLVAWMSRAEGHGHRGVVAPYVLPGVLMLAGIGATILASSELAYGELADTDASKLHLVRAAFRIVPDFPLFGVGRGAFESVFPAYRADHSYLVYDYPEDIVAQWTTEWGLPVAILAFGALAVALRPATAMARSPRAAGAWAALAVLGVHNLVDFGSEYPAMIIALATCAGIVTGGTSGVDSPRALDGWARRPRWLVSVAGLSCLGAVALVLPGWSHDLAEDRAALHAGALDANVPRGAFEAEAASAMLRHPAEPYLPFTGALRAVRAGDASPLPWIGRTIERALVYGPAHLVLARWLAPRSRSQARLEYRFAVEQAPEELAHYELAALPLLVDQYDDAVELLPRGDAEGRGVFIDFLARTVGFRLPATARRLDDLAVELDPKHLGFAERRAQEGLADVLAGESTSWCAGGRRAACLEKALESASRLMKIAPTECEGHFIHARLLLARGDGARAVSELRGAADSVLDRTDCLERLVGLATLARADDAVTQALDRITHAGCAAPPACVANLRFVAATEAARGYPRMGLAALKRATALAPTDDGLLVELAAIATKLEMHVDALSAYDALSTRQPTDPRWPAAAAAERAALLGSP